jgi:hypothetical protein
MLQEDKLKTAILDYLKHFHSDDKDTYSMVALNFSMYREIGQMLEDSGHHHLDLLREKAIGKLKQIFRVFTPVCGVMCDCECVFCTSQNLLVNKQIG